MATSSKSLQTDLRNEQHSTALWSLYTAAKRHRPADVIGRFGKEQGHPLPSDCVYRFWPRHLLSFTEKHRPRSVRLQQALLFARLAETRHVHLTWREMEKTGKMMVIMVKKDGKKWQKHTEARQGWTYTRRLPYCGMMAGKRDKKTTLHLLYAQ